MSDRRPVCASDGGSSTSARSYSATASSYASTATARSAASSEYSTARPPSSVGGRLREVMRDRGQVRAEVLAEDALQHVPGRAMQLRLADRRKIVVQRLAHQVVHERERPRRGGVFGRGSPPGRPRRRRRSSGRRRSARRRRARGDPGRGRGPPPRAACRSSRETSVLTCRRISARTSSGIRRIAASSADPSRPSAIRTRTTSPRKNGLPPVTLCTRAAIASDVGSPPTSVR